VPANQTSTIAVFPGQFANFWAYRKILAAQTRTVAVLGVASLLGGAAGAIILLNTSTPAFDLLVPWLLLSARHQKQPLVLRSVNAVLDRIKAKAGISW
jgi:uncharacterized protein